MLKSVSIEGYRCFEKLEVSGLRRVNLIVGRNNSGKTSLMEAIRLIGGRDNLVQVMCWNAMNRGDFISGTQRQYIFSELMHWSLDPANQCIQLKCTKDSQDKSFGVNIWKLDYQKLKAITKQDDPQVSGENPGHGTVLAPVESEPYKNLVYGALHVTDSLVATELDLTSNPGAKAIVPSGVRDGRWVGSTVPDAKQIVSDWGRVVKRSRKFMAENIVSLLDPTAGSVDFAPEDLSLGSHIPHLRDFQINVKTAGEMYPLTSFGEGLVRTFAIVLRITALRSGQSVFLDEIDTGIHHTAMSDVWRAVIQAAKENNVQVFATTHSKDCIDGLAKALLLDESSHDLVALHGLEQGREDAVNLDADAIISSLTDGMEVRGI